MAFELEILSEMADANSSLRIPLQLALPWTGDQPQGRRRWQARVSLDRHATYVAAAAFLVGAASDEPSPSRSTDLEVAPECLAHDLSRGCFISGGALVERAA